MKKKPKTDGPKTKSAARNVGNKFRKGRSGNPNGRPKGSRNLISVLTEEAEAAVTVTVGGRKRVISKVQAAAMQLATQAAGGDRASIVKFLDWMDEVEARAAAARPSEFPFCEADLEVLNAVHARIQEKGAATDPTKDGEP